MVCQVNLSAVKCLCIWNGERFRDYKCWTCLFHWFLSYSGEAPHLCIQSSAAVITLRYWANTARHRDAHEWRSWASSPILSHVLRVPREGYCTRDSCHCVVKKNKKNKPLHRSFIWRWLCGCWLVNKSSRICPSLSWFVPLSEFYHHVVSCLTANLACAYIYIACIQISFFFFCIFLRPKCFWLTFLLLC